MDIKYCTVQIFSAKNNFSFKQKIKNFEKKIVSLEKTTLFYLNLKYFSNIDDQNSELYRWVREKCCNIFFFNLNFNSTSEANKKLINFETKKL